MYQPISKMSRPLKLKSVLQTWAIWDANHVSMTKKILIIGAGIAGLTAAYWLHRYGFDVEIVEKSNQCPRNPGYLMDFWGAGFDVCEKMQLLDALTQKSFSFNEFI